MRIDISNILNKSNKSAVGSPKTQELQGIARYVLPEKGQLLEGEILDILQNRVTIRLLNGQQISAKMLEDIPFKIGDRITFEIKDSTSEQLTLKPIIEGNTSLQNISDILVNAKLDESEQNVQLVKQLLENNMPINKETVQQLHMYSKRFPEAKIESLIFLVKNNMIVSDESINYVDRLIHDQQNISKEFTSFSRMVSTLIKEPEVQAVVEKMVPPNQPQQALIKIAFSLLEPQTKANPPQELLPEQVKFVETTLQKDVISQLPDSVKAMVMEKMPELQSIKTMGELQSFFDKFPFSEDMKVFIKQALAERITETVLNQSMLLGREDILKHEELPKHFNKIYERFIDILENTNTNTLSQSGDKVIKEVLQLKTGLESMNQLQQNYQFIHLPIMLNQQSVNTQLYIMNKKGTRKNNKERITALLRLDFINLGQMDIYIAKQSKNVEVTFYVEGQASERILQDNTMTLHKALINKSFNVLGLGVRIKDTELKSVETFFNNQTGKSEPKRFTFDVRA